MGDLPTNQKNLKEKLLNSSKKTMDKSKVTNPITDCVASADNVINVISEPTQLSNNLSNTTVTEALSNKNNNNIQSVQNTILSNQILSNETNTNATTKKSFAETILNETCPKKDQAIVFDSIDNIPQIDYVLAICKLIPSKCINYVSRISNNRFCVYFTDKNSVDYLIENHSNIVINDHSSIKIRRLINPAKRIIISNVSPAIPNISIKALLQEHNIQLLSQITHINAGFNIKELAHILSFRRQVYINPNDFAKLPSSLLIIHDNTPHRRHSFMLQM